MTEKTKATLYLEEDLVRRAKESDLNMSEIANNALKQRFGLERETSRQRNLRELLQEVDEDGRLHSLASKVAGLELENIRKFDELSLEFQDGLNVIYGPNGSGKSTICEAVVNTVASSTGEVHREFVKHGRNSGSVRVELEDPVVFRQFSSGGQYDEGEGGVLLLDNPFVNYDEDYAREMVEQLAKEIDSQVILTTIHRGLGEEADNRIRLRSHTEERLEEVQEDLEEMEDELEMRKGRLMEATEEIEEIEHQIEDLQESKYRIETLEEEREDLLESIDELEREVGSLEAEVESVDAQLEETDSEREIGRLEERRDNLSTQLDEKREKLEMYRDHLDEIEGALGKLEESYEELQELRGRLEHKRNLRHELEDEVEELHTEVEVLREEKKEIKDNMEVAR